MNDIRELITKMETINKVIVEGKGHLDHPEDLVFLHDEQGARNAIDSIIATVQNPQAITIKWDGYPAIIFGRGSDGNFSIMDKHMFNKKDGSGRQIFSPQDFSQYDSERGVNRDELHAIINEIWNGLEKDDRAGNGYYWGDLLFSRPLVDRSGIYRFKANPNGIEYEVDVNSDVGKLLTNKRAGIAVHQFIPADAVSTDQAVSLDGTIGNLQNASDIAILPCKMPITPQLKLNENLKKIAEDALLKYGNQVKELMTNAPQSQKTFSQLFTVFVNKKIVSGSLTNLARDFMDFVEAKNMSPKMKAKIAVYLNQHKQDIIGAFKIWAALYNLKMDIVNQLNNAAQNSPIRGYLANGKQSQEGFVSHGLKFVDRLGFSRQNLQGK
jgi:hypothetical protein